MTVPLDLPVSRIAILSPHRDDAAFSCGVFLGACGEEGIEAVIVNVFTESAYAPYVEGNDVGEITRVRKEEDREMLRLLTDAGLRCSMEDLGLEDAPLRLGIAVEDVVRSPLSAERFEDEVSDLAARLLWLRTFDLVIVPLGLGGHVDHAIAREAGRRSVRPECLGFYEDLPYAARLNEAEREACVVHAGMGEGEMWAPVIVTMEGGGDLKRRLAAVYRSQIADEVVEEIADYATEMGEGERHYLPRTESDSVAASVWTRLLRVRSAHTSR